MASDKAITVTLALVAECRGATVTEHTTLAWTIALKDISDDELKGALRRYLRVSDDRFMPPPAVIRKLALARRAANPDTTPATAADLLRAIEQRVVFSPAGYPTWPRVESVRGWFGPAIAGAYGDIGAHRLFADHPTTRDIAAREFTLAVQAVPLAERPTEATLSFARPALPTPIRPPRALPSAPRRIADTLPEEPAA